MRERGGEGGVRERASKRAIERGREGGRKRVRARE